MSTEESKEMTGISLDLITKCQNEFSKDAKNQLSLNLGTRTDLNELCLDRLAIEKTNHVFTHKVREKPDKF